MLYTDFLSRKNVFSQRQFLSQNSCIQRSLTFLTIFRQREVCSITVLMTKIIPEKTLSNKDAKISHFTTSLKSKLAQPAVEKSDVVVEVFWNKLLTRIIKAIINSDCFSQNRSFKSALKYSIKAIRPFNVFI